MDVGTPPRTGAASIHTPSGAPLVRSRWTWLVPFVTAISIWLLYRLYNEDYNLSGSWGCEMSWMTPSYEKIETTASPVPRYGLYLYREHDWDESPPLDGHPVIFVPGNAGSYQQVRSIASSASRQYHGQPRARADNMENAQKLDVFTVDLNEDLSAFHGHTVRQQADFLTFCIGQVLSLYEHLPPSRRPSKVTLLGHSMGGIVSRLAVSIGSQDLVDVILTMSTPHLLPPVTLDYEFERIYAAINSNVTFHHALPLLISICGGLSDSQIASESCALSRDQISPNDGFAVFATGIPGAWTGVDHQAMVWCHQIRWRIARALLEMSGKPSRHFKLESAKSWLLGFHEVKTGPSTEGQSPHLEEFSIDSTNLTIIVHGPSISSQDHVPALQVQQCDPTTNFCKSVDYRIGFIPWNLNEETPFPSPGEGSRPTDSGYILTLYNLHVGRHLKIWVPVGLTVLHGDHHQFVNRGSHWVSELAIPTTHVSLEFPLSSAQSSLQVYGLRATLGSCQGPRPIIRHRGRPHEFLQGITSEDRFFPLSVNQTLLHTHLGNSPYIMGGLRTSLLRLDIYQHPDCPVQDVQISSTLRYAIPKAIARYRMTFMAWTLGWSSMILGFQLFHFDKAGEFPAIYSVLTRRVLVLALIGLLCAFSVQSGLSRSLVITDWLLGVAALSHLPFCLGMAAMSLLCVLSMGSFLQASRAVSQVLFTPKPAVVNMVATIPYANIFSAIGLLAICGVVLPQQLVHIILFLGQWVIYAISPSTDRSMVNILHSVLLLQSFLLPHHLVVLAVWSRTLLVDWRHMPHMDHNILKIVPVLGLVGLSSIGHGLRRRKILNRLGVCSWFCVAGISFIWGPRHTYLLPRLTDLGLIVTWGVLWP